MSRSTLVALTVILTPLSMTGPLAFAAGTGTDSRPSNAGTSADPSDVHEVRKVAGLVLSGAGIVVGTIVWLQILATKTRVGLTSSGATLAGTF